MNSKERAFCCDGSLTQGHEIVRVRLPDLPALRQQLYLTDKLHLYSLVLQALAWQRC